MALFGVFGDAARLYVLLWRHSIPAAALAPAAVENELLFYGLTVLVTPYVAHVLSALHYRLADPDPPVIAPRHAAFGSAWEEHALEDARQAGG